MKLTLYTIVCTILFLAFASQCYKAAVRYMDGDISKTIKVVASDTLKIPAVTICPYFLPKYALDKGKTFSSLVASLPQIQDFLYFMEINRNFNK